MKKIEQYIFIISYHDNRMLYFCLENKKKDIDSFNHRVKLNLDDHHLLPYRSYDLSNQPQEKQDMIINIIKSNINKSDIDSKLLLLGIIENNCKLIGCNRYDKFNENVKKYSENENIQG